MAIFAAPDFKNRETPFETAVSGFGVEDSDPVVTDNIAHAVTWKRSADLSKLKGRPVYLRFRLKNAGI